MRSSFLILAVATLTAAGCAAGLRATVEVPASVLATEVDDARPAIDRPPLPDTPSAAPEDNTGEAADGVVHIVQPGQTLWRIARAYDVPLETIARANDIADPTHVDIGTPLFVPGALATIDVAPYPAPPPSAHRPPDFRPESAADFLWPVRGGEFMHPYGEPRRHHVHAGVDIRGARGQEILAARDGVVAFAGRTKSGYGTMVVIDHGDGVQTLYAHALKVLVRHGEPIQRGAPIALVGRTGNATTEHCHFELRVENRPIDPMPYLSSTMEARR